MTWTLVGRKFEPLTSASATVTSSLLDLTGGIDTEPSEGDAVFFHYSQASGAIAGDPPKVNTPGYDSKGIKSIDSWYTWAVAGVKVMGATPDTEISITQGQANATYTSAILIEVWRCSDGIKADQPADTGVKLTASANTGRPNPDSITPGTSGALIIASGSASYTSMTDFTSSDLSGFFADSEDVGSYAVGIGAGYHEWTSGAYDPAQFGGGVTSTSASATQAILALRPAGITDTDWQLVGETIAQYSSGSSTLTASLTSLTGGIDTQPSSGDVVVVFHSATHGSGATGNTLGITTAGYTSDQIGADDTYDIVAQLGVKQMGGSPDTSVQVSRSVTGYAAGVLIKVYRGADPSTPIDATITKASGNNGGQPTPPAIAAATAGALIISGGAAGGNVVFDPFSPGNLSFMLGDFNNTSGTWRTNAAIAQHVVTASGTYTPEQWSGGSTATTTSWAALTVALRPFVEPDTYSMSGDAITGSAPASDSPALTQGHSVAAAAITGTAPAIDHGTLAQAHSLAGDAITAGAPVLDTPTVSGGNVDVSGSAIDGSAPLVDTPDLTQAHGLTPADLSTGPPALDSATLAQDHSLTAAAIVGSAPVLDNGSLSAVHVLAGDAILGGAALLDAGALSQDSALDGDAVSADTPTLDSAALAQLHGVAADPVVLPAPTIDVATLAQDHAMSGAAIAGTSPTLASPALTQAQTLSGDELAAGAPLIDSPAIAQSGDLAGDAVTVGIPLLDAGSLAQAHSLTGEALDGAPPTLDAGTLTQGHSLNGDGLTGSVPQLDEGALGGDAAVTGTAIAGEAPAIDEGALTQAHSLYGNPIAGEAPILDSPALDTSVSVSAVGVAAGSPVLDAGGLTQAHSLTADAVTAEAPAIDSAILSQATVFLPGPILAGVPEIDQGAVTSKSPSRKATAARPNAPTGHRPAALPTSRRRTAIPSSRRPRAR